MALTTANALGDDTAGGTITKRPQTESQDGARLAPWRDRTTDNLTQRAAFPPPSASPSESIGLGRIHDRQHEIRDVGGDFLEFLRQHGRRHHTGAPTFDQSQHGQLLPAGAGGQQSERVDGLYGPAIRLWPVRHLQQFRRYRGYALGSIGGFDLFSFKPKNAGAGTVTITPTSGLINGGTSLELFQNQATEVVADGSGNYHIDPALSGQTIVAPVISGGSFEGTIDGSGIISGGTFNASVINGATVDGGTINSATIDAGTINGATIAGGSINGATTGPLCGQIEVTLTAPVNPTHTVNSAGVMMGLGSGAAAATIIPINTSRVRACFFGTFAPGTSGTYTTTATMYYGVSASNAVPPNGGAISGSTAGAVVMNEVTTSASKTPFSMEVILSDLTDGAYWFDIALAPSTSGSTAAITNVTFVAHEI